jgi:hypothetical protein
MYKIKLRSLTPLVVVAGRLARHGGDQDSGGSRTPVVRSPSPGQPGSRPAASIVTYNTDLFQAAGVTPPAIGWTMDVFENLRR